MDKMNIDFEMVANEMQKGGALIEKIIAGNATEEEKIKVKEIIWTITCKIEIRKLVSDIPMPQKELARLINVHPTMITEYKKGKSLPSMPTLLLMLSVLKPEMIYTITSGNIKEVNEMFKSLGIDLFM